MTTPLTQVLMPESMLGPFREWLAARRLYLYPIPGERDLPTFGIGIDDEKAGHPRGRDGPP